MDIKKLQRVIVEALEDVKGQDIRAFNSTGLTDLFDRVVIATGTSNRHTKALANSVRESVKAAGGDVLSMEGEEGGEWVLVDLGDAIVHIMQGPIRSYYNLEELWGDKPVALKPSAAAKTSARFATVEHDDSDTALAPAKSAKPRVPAKKAVSKTSAAPTAAKKAPAKHAPAKSALAKRSPAKRPAAKRAAK
jgi:ribosome-associated protein